MALRFGIPEEQYNAMGADAQRAHRVAFNAAGASSQAPPPLSPPPAPPGSSQPPHSSGRKTKTVRVENGVKITTTTDEFGFVTEAREPFTEDAILNPKQDTSNTVDVNGNGIPDSQEAGGQVASTKQVPGGFGQFSDAFARSADPNIFTNGRGQDTNADGKVDFTDLLTFAQGATPEHLRVPQTGTGTPPPTTTPPPTGTPPPKQGDQRLDALYARAAQLGISIEGLTLEEIQAAVRAAEGGGQQMRRGWQIE